MSNSVTHPMWKRVEPGVTQEYFLTYRYSIGPNRTRKGKVFFVAPDDATAKEYAALQKHTDYTVYKLTQI